MLPFLRPTLAPASIFTSAVTSSGRPAPTLVVDLDDTVLYRTRGALDAALVYGLPPSLAAAWVGEPYAGALEALRGLSRSYRIVALTARWAAGARYTHAWLERHGLGGLPVIVAVAPHPGDDSRVAFKAAAVAWLAAGGWAPLVGVGDRPSDLEAYAAAGLHAAVVAHAPLRATPASAANECWRVLAAAAARARDLDARGPTLPGAAAGGCGRAASVAFFTDCAEVHAAAAAATAAAGAGGGRGGGGARGSPEAPGSAFPVAQAWAPPRRVPLGPTWALGALPLHVPATGGDVPPVWAQAQLRGYLEALAAADEAEGGPGGGPGGGAARGAT